MKFYSNNIYQPIVLDNINRSFSDFDYIRYWLTKNNNGTYILNVSVYYKNNQEFIQWLNDFMSVLSNSNESLIKNGLKNYNENIK